MKEIALGIMGGLKPGNNCVRDSRQIRLLETGEIEFVGEMDRAQFAELLAFLKKMTDSLPLALGSACRYGIKHYGKEAVASMLEQLQFDHMDAERGMTIGQMELNFSKRKELNWGHYWVLGKLLPGDDASQNKWGDEAMLHGLTAHELKLSIEQGKITRAADAALKSGRGSGGVVSFDGFETYVSRFEAAIGGKEALLTADREVKEQFLKSTAHVVELREAVEATLR